MNEGENFEGAELPEIEVVEGEKEYQDIDLAGQIKALENQIDSLETKYDESDKARIDALKRERAKLEEELGSSK